MEIEKRVKLFCKKYKITPEQENDYTLIIKSFFNSFFDVHIKEDTRPNFLSWIQNIFPKSTENEENIPDKERFFDCLVPILLALRKKDEAISLITAACADAIIGSTTLKKDKKFAITKFTIFVLNNCNRELSADEQQSIKKIKNSDITPHIETGVRSNKSGRGIIHNNSGREIYLKDDVIATMMGRLRRQDRLSGDKVWLPLGVINKVYNPQSDRRNIEDTTYSDWIKHIAENIFIHYKDYGKIQNNKDCGKIQKTTLSKISLLLFYPNDSGSKDVYAAMENGEDQIKIIRLYTPTGKLNQKCEAKVNSIDGLEIDHVKPIDATLRDLYNKNCFQALILVSDAMKKVKNLKMTYASKCKEAYSILEKDYTQYFDSFDSFKEKLKDELYLISKDSPCRLMDANMNCIKSNLMTYKYFKKFKGFFYGIIYGDGENETCVDDKNQSIIICHRLDTEGLMIYSKNDVILQKLKNKNEIPINEMDLNLI